MTKTCFTHDDEFLVFSSGAKVGEIEFRLSYAVTYWGCPEQGPSYASAGEPAEGPEIEVLSVDMIASRNYAGAYHPAYVPAFPWLNEWVSTWAHETIDELVAAAVEELEGRREAAADAKYEDKRLEK